MLQKQLLQKVNSLILETDRANIKRSILDIGTILCNSILITKTGIQIKPIWVEAYYYNEETFPDLNVHLVEAQKSSWFYLYVHQCPKQFGDKRERCQSRNGKKHKGTIPGVDICLHTGDKEYFFSFLLKNTIVDGEYLSDKGINNLIKQLNLEDRTIVEIKNTDVPCDIKTSNRIGIADNEYEELAIFNNVFCEPKSGKVFIKKLTK